MTEKYKEWCIEVEDLKERNPSILDERERCSVENLVGCIFLILNNTYGGNSGKVDVNNLKVIREGESFVYFVYFTINNSISGGYSRMMFN